jgi:UrcA family protein
MHVSTLFPAATLLAALSFGAHADTSSPGNSSSGRIAVYYGDLNIKTEQNAKIMLERIELAAEKACRGHATFGSYIGSLERTFEECRSETVQRTVKQLGAPIVTRIYSQARPR